MSNNQGSFEAEFKLDPRLPSEGGLADEHCKAKLKQIQDIGRHRNEQVRIEFPTTNDGNTSAIYTVTVFHADAGSVILGHKIPNLSCRLTENKCKGVVKAQIMLEGLDDDKARENGEFIEHLTDDGQNTGLIVIAPHGGNIEQHTDEQAQYVYDQLLLPSSYRVSTWICKGFNNEEDGGAFNRWHITSIDISENSFPKLKTVYRRGFEYAVAFHGFSDEKHPKSICIGGITNDKKLKEDIKMEIESKNAGIKVYMDNECPRNIDGDDVKNIVNRLSTNALQIEQTKEVRDESKLRLIVADAVVKVIGPKITV